MKWYTAKYYPLVNGSEKEYKTTVEADNKVEAEFLVRKAFIDRQEWVLQTIKSGMAACIGGMSAESVKKDIEYAKNGMRIEILDT